MSTCDSDEEQLARWPRKEEGAEMMTEQEIADEMGISKQRVCFLLQRALGKLKPLFEARGYTDSKWK